MSRIAAKKVHVGGVSIPNPYGGYYRYPSQSYIVIDRRAYEVFSTSGVGHKSQSEIAIREASQTGGDVELQVKKIDNTIERLVAYLPGSDVEVGYAERSSTVSS